MFDRNQKAHWWVEQVIYFDPGYAYFLWHLLFPKKEKYLLDNSSFYSKASLKFN